MGGAAVLARCGLSLVCAPSFALTAGADRPVRAPAPPAASSAAAAGLGALAERKEHLCRPAKKGERGGEKKKN